MWEGVRVSELWKDDGEDVIGGSEMFEICVGMIVGKIVVEVSGVEKRG